MTRPDRRDFLKKFALGAGAFASATGNVRAGDRPAAAGPIPLGVCVPIGRRVFPDDNAWNTDVSKMPVDPRSDALIAAIGADKPLHPDFGPPYEGRPVGIPYVVVAGTQARMEIPFEYAEESDDGYYPIPADAPIEGGDDVPRGSDRHVLVIDRDNWRLYELFSAFRDGKGGWRAGSGAIYDLNSNALRPAGWTSADAAGLPIFPGLVRYDEVVGQGAVRHAVRFTVQKTRRAYVWPARHWASLSKDPALPPMGLRVRLKAGYDTSRFPAPAKVILEGLKRYGMLLADNGSDWFITGAPDPRWDNEELGTLKRVKGHDLEVVRMGRVVTG